MNKVILIGHLGQDPENKSKTDGKFIVSVSLSTKMRYTDAAGVKQERTSWHRLKAFGKIAELMVQYSKKGDKLAITGHLNYDEYTDKDNVKRTSTDIIVDEMEFVGSKRETTEAPKEARIPEGAAQRTHVSSDDDNDLPF